MDTQGRLDEASLDRLIAVSHERVRKNPPARFASRLRNHIETCPVARTLARLRRCGSDALFGRPKNSQSANAKPRDVAPALQADDTSPPSLHPL